MVLASYKKLYFCHLDNSQNTNSIDTPIGLEVDGAKISVGIENQKRS